VRLAKNVSVKTIAIFPQVAPVGSGRGLKRGEVFTADQCLVALMVISRISRASGR
jgi:thiazole synthase ThiGH ThiG subunit